MRTVRLGSTDQHVSAIALGCMLMGTTTGEPDAFDMLDRFAEAGGTFLDTADCYAWWNRRGSTGGESEHLLGRWLRRGGRREDMFIATKGSAVPVDTAALWPAAPEEQTAGPGLAAGPDVTEGPDWDMARRTFGGASARVIGESIDASLRRLGVDTIDLYYVHVDDRSTPLEETLAALTAAVQAGKIRYIGWSNVRTWRLERIRGLCQRNGWSTPVAVQQEHSYLRPRPDVDNASIVDFEQRDYLREHDDLSLVAYSPILKGIYNDPVKRAGHNIMGSYAGPDATARCSAVDQVAERLGVTGNQVVLAWLLAQRSPRVLPLVGPRTVAQFTEAMAAVDIELDEATIAQLNAATG